MAKQEASYGKDDFIATNWRECISEVSKHGYISASLAFGRASTVYRESKEASKAKIMELLGRACSMMFDVKSINSPFSPMYQGISEGRRSTLPEDFTSEELAFFESILIAIDEPWLKARIADVLWLCKKPKSIEHAKAAILTYISHPIDPNTWLVDRDSCWERACRLCFQIREFKAANIIGDHIYSKLTIEYPESTFMTLWLARLLDDVNLASDKVGDIAQRLFTKAQELKLNADFSNARSYSELSSKLFLKGKDNQGWLESLVHTAECFELEADKRSSDSQMVANSFYENAIQAYRRIPVKHRATYNVEDKLRSLRAKLAVSGAASLEEMGVFQTPAIDIKDTVELSISHVKGKESVETALLYFSGLFDGPIYSELRQSAEESIAQNPLSAILGSTQMSADGRVVAKTPSIDLGTSDGAANCAALRKQVQLHLSIEIQSVVEGRILPALRQILMEHRITREFLVALCKFSPIVPLNREQLMASAIWMGFEYEFSNAIHLLCPQLEHMVRVMLKEAGAITSAVGRDGVEHENGLSTLMALPEINNLLGEDVSFGVKAIFTDAIGPNLRNEVAHGLLDDNAASSIPSVFGWWMILRLIIRSMAGHEVASEKSKEKIKEEGAEESAA